LQQGRCLRRKPLKYSGLKWVFVATLAFGAITVEPAAAQRRNGFFAQLFGTGQNTRSQPQLSANQRAINRAVQTALNFFEFDAGTVDGIIGRKSRTAATAFQALMGYEETGRLNREESQFLLSAFNEFANKDEASALKISLGLTSAQELLLAFAAGDIVPTELPPEDPAPRGPLSMRRTCVDIGAAGPADLLKGQFCNLRSLAIAQADFLIENTLNGQSRAPVYEECAAFTEEMRPQIDQISTRPAAETLEEMGVWYRRSGLSGEKLAQLAETCLGLGYMQDDTDSALAGLLVLVGLKDAIYIEQMGYHIALGLGAGAGDYAQGHSWMEAAVAAQPEGDLSLTAQDSNLRIGILADVLGILSAAE